MTMFFRAISISVATLLAVGALAASAQADHRKKPRRAIAYDHYYAGPQIVRGVPGLRLFFGDYALTEEEFDALYGVEDGIDESYYEPQPAVPAKPLKKKSTVKSAKTKAAPDELTTASIGKTAKPAAKTTAAKTTAAPASPAGMSCDKAGSIIAGYGFSGIKAETCKGKVYAFNATRDGKPFAIKLDAASGELTEVKKLQ
jgi:hypothetical protein